MHYCFVFCDISLVWNYRLCAKLTLQCFLFNFMYLHFRVHFFNLSYSLFRFKRKYKLKYTEKRAFREIKWSHRVVSQSFIMVSYSYCNKKINLLYSNNLLPQWCFWKCQVDFISFLFFFLQFTLLQISFSENHNLVPPVSKPKVTVAKGKNP